jgi:signal peptidase I
MANFDDGRNNNGAYPGANPQQGYTAQPGQPYYAPQPGQEGYGQGQAGYVGQPSPQVMPGAQVEYTPQGYGQPSAPRSAYGQSAPLPTREAAADTDPFVPRRMQTRRQAQLPQGYSQPEAYQSPVQGQAAYSAQSGTAYGQPYGAQQADAYTPGQGQSLYNTGTTPRVHDPLQDSYVGGSLYNAQRTQVQATDYMTQSIPRADLGQPQPAAPAYGQQSPAYSQQNPAYGQPQNQGAPAGAFMQQNTASQPAMSYTGSIPAQPPAGYPGAQQATSYGGDPYQNTMMLPRTEAAYPEMPLDGTMQMASLPGYGTGTPMAQMPQGAPPPTMPPQAQGQAGAMGGEEDRPPKSALRNAVEWIAVLASAFIIAILLHTFVVSFNGVLGPSMEPTLYTGERVLVNRMAYAFGSEVRRFDIVVCHYPDEDDYYIKRVIGLPGEKIAIIEGKVFINGQAIVEDHVKNVDMESMEEMTIPEGEYFVMGDNRANSLDSRSQSVGTLPRKNLAGRAVAVIWPFSEFKKIERADKETGGLGYSNLELNYQAR